MLMNDSPITTEELQEIEKELSIFSDSNKSPYEIVSGEGHHLLDIGPYVEAWLSDKYCFVFEDSEVIAGFAHHDSTDDILMKYISSIYNNELSNYKVKH